MYKSKSVAVVVPCYNEEKLIGRVIETMPEFVDHIVCVDDQSRDRTAEIVERYSAARPERVILIRLPKNEGVGGAIAAGYRWARDRDIDATAVMAGDAQMDPGDLHALLEPVIADETDYAKGNRLFTGEAWNLIPRVRYIGNGLLSMLTKIASGYWHVADSQTGYTVTNRKVLKTLNLDDIYKRYGMPNDMLVKLNIFDFRVRDIPIKPIYGIGEQSGIKPIRLVPRLSLLLVRLFVYRMLQKYIIRDFHPLVLFYFTGAVLLSLGMLVGLYVVMHRLFIGFVADNTPLFTTFLVLMGWQSVMFAMWLDMEMNKHLK
ncbi:MULTISPECIES: glycosyltransferase family 2 protein [unclassified Bradyrhizobium]|uniref:glycosyltransferase family 2 protein n=1 Tax=unclassified Bradyrhizobium TaxID=2631580 RepID=UPI001BA5EDB3|nr:MULTISPECIES: glycosyltransferase family 2 protein [unclassified Bradyrhizobium]MBR1203948.1 glycosyltransferase family 2 protein [Bradyrhizobium sp. AUGA SZCCT0124]MBR1310166.1 glycosyltransferase family 2 protein [Bradyrhizobium sp. AUGA SZCCT0051]MBR1340307.1 glycosyltransferase family 2 protein [Bradyrhizobium sp. AUGA SZCCT0105]MBR1354914.1 glycosyltransferase family 2 protein [Bradyrhizobium sp. AUGA SZCCT0045]